MNPSVKRAIQRTARQAERESPSAEVKNAVVDAAVALEVERMKDTEILVARIKAVRQSHK